jgi:hypothetical protein
MTSLTIKVEIDENHVRRVPLSGTDASLESLYIAIDRLLPRDFELCDCDDEILDEETFRTLKRTAKEQELLPRVRARPSLAIPVAHPAHPMATTLPFESADEDHIRSSVVTGGSDEDFALALHLTELEELEPSSSADHAMAVNLQQQLENEERDATRPLAVQDGGVGWEVFSIADGSPWGVVIGDEGAIWRLASGRIAKKQKHGSKWRWGERWGSNGAHRSPHQPLSLQSVQQHVKAARVQHLVNRVLAIKCTDRGAPGGPNQYADALVEKVNADGTLFVRWVSDGSVSMRVEMSRVELASASNSRARRTRQRCPTG